MNDRCGVPWMSGAPIVCRRPAGHDGAHRNAFYGWIWVHPDDYDGARFEGRWTLRRRRSWDPTRGTWRKPRRSIGT